MLRYSVSSKCFDTYFDVGIHYTVELRNVQWESDNLEPPRIISRVPTRHFLDKCGLLKTNNICSLNRLLWGKP